MVYWRILQQFQFKLAIRESGALLWWFLVSPQEPTVWVSLLGWQDSNRFPLMGVLIFFPSPNIFSSSFLPTVSTILCPTRSLGVRSFQVTVEETLGLPSCSASKELARPSSADEQGSWNSRTFPLASSPFSQGRVSGAGDVGIDDAGHPLALGVHYLPPPSPKKFTSPPLNGIKRKSAHGYNFPNKPISSS